MSRRFTKWVFKTADGESVTVEVRTEFDPHIGCDHFTVDLKDVLPLQEDENPIRADTDIARLKKTVKGVVAEHGSVAWEAWLQVSVRRFGHGKKPGDIVVKEEGEAGCDLAVNATPVDLGVRPDGKKVHRMHKVGAYRDQRVERDWPEVGKDIGSWSSEMETVALVEDTAENRAALNAIFAGMERMSDALQGLMMPSRIKGTLARALETNLLPAPTEERP